MSRLEDVRIEELDAALEVASGKREILRVVAAILYKRGPSVPMIAEWFDVREQTIYRWFDRFEGEPVERAIRDRPRSGRPPKLDDADRKAFRRAIRQPPTAVGYDEDSWTAELAQDFIADEFGVDYSRRHVQRLLDDVGSP